MREYLVYFTVKYTVHARTTSFKIYKQHICAIAKNTDSEIIVYEVYHACLLCFQHNFCLSNIRDGVMYSACLTDSLVPKHAHGQFKEMVSS